MSDQNVETQTFEQRVTSIVNEAKVDESGNLVLPENLELDEATSYAVKTEKRRRDTQSAFTKAQQQIKQLSAAQAETLSVLEQEVSVDLTVEELTELEELKVRDPEAWRLKLNQHDSKKKDKVTAISKKINEKTSHATALEARTALLVQHNEANPDFVLTDEVIDNDIPPRFTKQLASGEITFEAFIKKCDEYLRKGKVMTPGTEADTDLDLSKTTGSSRIPDVARKGASSGDYKKETY